MHEVLAMPSGRWLRIDTAAEADIAASRTGTDIAIMFRRFHPEGSEFYFFDDGTGLSPASICLGDCLGSVGDKGDKAMVTGHRNANPFLEHADLVAAFSIHVGRALGAVRYPHRMLDEEELDDYAA